MIAYKNTHFSNLDYILIALTIVLLIFSWVYIIISYNSLPSIIAVHFDILGKPNGYNSKENIWFAPFVSTILSAGFILGAKYQKVVSFPKRKLNALEKKSNIKTMIFTALLLATLCLLIIHTIIKSSKIKGLELHWIMPIVIGIILIYLALVSFYKFKSIK
ncbi:DUF1648 domain-containing protein [Polaribacter sp. IC073]|uniref:DUF1648 domain-containing protein n=1 Tax=Polaribacter sp. IC073 TaxID=2508540 RepID=UPI0011BF80D8|nr:DUF1648 domain-containing protein [Polaribacter sp. IC073]TXD48750.1 DUF1648 domain-containing protein [Polaribacter sp. IC073]